MRRRAFLCLISLLAVADAHAAAEVLVTATRRGGALEIHCHARLEAPPQVVWSTLTDYDRLAGFVPGMRSSRLVSRSANVAVVEQVGEARVLFLGFPIEVTLSASERPIESIEMRLLRGNLKRLEAVYRIEPQPGQGATLDWTGFVEPDFLPPLVGPLVLRASIEAQFRGVVAEIERRDALRREGRP